MSYDLYAMEDGNLLKTHGPAQCAGQHCALHNPSDHPLAHAPMNWDSSRNLMVRFCPHNVWHPDADDLAYKHRSAGAAWASNCELHKCDGCCSGKPELTPTMWDLTRWAAIAWWEWIKSFFARG
jgi:hypothetical protein